MYGMYRVSQVLFCIYMIYNLRLNRLGYSFDLYE